MAVSFNPKDMIMKSNSQVVFHWDLMLLGFPLPSNMKHICVRLAISPSTEGLALLASSWRKFALKPLQTIVPPPRCLAGATMTLLPESVAATFPKMRWRGQTSMSSTPMRAPAEALTLMNLCRLGSLWRTRMNTLSLSLWAFLESWTSAL